MSPFLDKIVTRIYLCRAAVIFSTSLLRYLLPQSLLQCRTDLPPPDVKHVTTYKATTLQSLTMTNNDGDVNLKEMDGV